MKKFYVYKVTNLVNNKVYIGKTSNVEKRWLIHCKLAKKNIQYPLQKAINKYGSGNFDISIIKEFEHEKDALASEIYWIGFYKTNICRYGNNFGYNLTDGGDGVSGYHHTDETKKKISKTLSGINKPHSEEWGRNISKALTGRKLSLNTSRQKLKLRKNNAKLNWDLVRKIRIEFSHGGATYKKLSEKYEVTTKTIENIIKNKSWKE